MANSPDTDDSIEGLLEQRTRFEQWLAKLDATGDKAPAAVRQKVRADYEARLRGVIDRLRGHAATIAEELQRHQASRSDLDGRRRGAEEELAEAEVRYAVGEFSEDEWTRIRDESERQLAGCGTAPERGRRDRPAGRGAGAHLAAPKQSEAAPASGPGAAPERRVDRALAAAAATTRRPPSPRRAGAAGRPADAQAAASPGRAGACRSGRKRRAGLPEVGGRGRAKAMPDRGAAIPAPRRRSRHPERWRRLPRPARPRPGRLGWRRPSSAASAAPSTGRRSGTASAVAPSWRGSEEGTTRGPSSPLETFSALRRYFLPP